MAIDPLIKKETDVIRNEQWADKVRSSIANGLDYMSEDVVEIDNRQKSLESDFVAVQQDARSNTPSGAELAVAAGEYNTLGERLDAEEQKVAAQLAQIAINPKSFGAVGDGTSHPLSDHFPTLADAQFVYPLATSLNDEMDWAALQKTINYAYDNNLRINVPKGVFLINKPLIVYGRSDVNTDKSTFITGSGRRTTVIMKTTHSTLSGGEYAGIDAAMFIANEYVKNATPITNYYTNQSIARKIFLDSFTLDSSTDTPVEYAVYTLGIYHSKLFNIEYTDGFNNGMYSKIYNCYNTYERLEVAVKRVGFDFLSPISGNSTINFKDVHINGVDVYGYKIKGGARFENCSSDGGALMPYYFINAKVLMDFCHFESPAAKGAIEAVASDVTIIKNGIEIQMTNGSSTFKVRTNSLIHVIDSSLSVANRGSAFPSTSPGRMIDADVSSRVVFDNLTYKEGSYDIETFYSISENEKKILFDRKRRSEPYHTYTSYVASSTPSADFPVINAITTPETIYFTSTGPGTAALVFGNKVNLANYSRVYLRATIDLNGTGNGDNTYGVRVRINDTKNAAGQVFQGTPAVFARSSDPYFYDATDKELFIDVSDLFGEYYIEIATNKESAIAIKEVALLK